MNEITIHQESSWLRDQLAIVLSDCDKGPWGALQGGGRGSGASGGSGTPGRTSPLQEGALGQTPLGGI